MFPGKKEVRQVKVPEALEYLKRESEGRLEYELKAEDYILSQDWEFSSLADTSQKFDFIIFKLHNDFTSIYIYYTPFPTFML